MELRVQTEPPGQREAQELQGHQGHLEPPARAVNQELPAQTVRQTEHQEYLQAQERAVR